MLLHSALIMLIDTFDLKNVVVNVEMNIKKCCRIIDHS